MMSVPLNSILVRLDEGVKPRGNGFRAHCPAHNDRTPSLDIAQNDAGDVLLHCHAGCSATQIVSALGLRLSDLFASSMRCPNRIRPREYERRSCPKWPVINPKWRKIAEYAFKNAWTYRRDKLEQLAENFGVSLNVLGPEGLRVGWLHATYARRAGSPTSADAWVFEEMNGVGQTVGVVFRYLDGKKRSAIGAKRGLTIPSGIGSTSNDDETIYVPEGASDVAAILNAGGIAIGRDTCYSRMGSEYLARFLRARGREIIIVGENDRKPDGTWPGRVGAERTRNILARRLSQSVRIVFPPSGFKDARGFLTELDRGVRRA